MKPVFFFLKLHEGVSKNRFFYPPNHPILIGFSIIFTIHFGFFPLYLETPMKQKGPGNSANVTFLGWFF